MYMPKSTYSRLSLELLLLSITIYNGAMMMHFVERESISQEGRGTLFVRQGKALHP